MPFPGSSGPSGPAPPTLAVTTETAPPARFIPVAAELAVGGTVTWRIATGACQPCLRPR